MLRPALTSRVKVTGCSLLLRAVGKSFAVFCHWASENLQLTRCHYVRYATQPSLLFGYKFPLLHSILESLVRLEEDWARPFMSHPYE